MGTMLAAHGTIEQEGQWKFVCRRDWLCYAQMCTTIILRCLEVMELEPWVTSNSHEGHPKYPRPPMSSPPPGTTVPPHPRGDGHQMTVPPPGGGGGHHSRQTFTSAYSAEFMASHAMHTIQISRILNAQHPLISSSAAPRLYVMVLYCSPCGEGPWTTASTGSFVERT